jgi:hypothetical protein
MEVTVLTRVVVRVIDLLPVTVLFPVEAMTFLFAMTRQPLTMA